MATSDKRDRDGAFLVQSFMTGEQRIMLSLEVREFDRQIRRQKKPTRSS
jgi:hypothetical protein